MYNVFKMWFAGVCLGMQLAVCEFARNELGWKGKLHERLAVCVSNQFFCLFVFLSELIFILCLCTDANSTEFDPDTKYPVVSNLF